MIKPKIRFNRDYLDPPLKDVSNWATVDSGSLNEKNAKRYNKLRKAVCEYLANKPVIEVCEDNGITRQELLRHVKRCLETHPDGRLWGFRSLISNTRQKSYERLAECNNKSSNRGAAGSLSKLFNSNPRIKEVVDELFLKSLRKGIVHEARIPLKSIHKRFLEVCREEGINSRSYPFSTKKLGQIALWNYLRKLFEQNLVKATQSRYGKEAARNIKTYKIEETDI